MKKITLIILSALLVIASIPGGVFAFSVDPQVQIRHSDSGTKSYSSLSEAMSEAVDGDTVTLAGEVSSLTVDAGVTVKKKITFEAGRDFYGNKKTVTYTASDSPLFTVEKGAVLTVTDSVITGNTTASLLKGGFAYVKKGGTLILDGKAGAELSISGFKLTAIGSKGGAIYCEKGGKVVINGVTFDGNSAGEGNDVYAELPEDVTAAQGVTFDSAYGSQGENVVSENVVIYSLNLVLSKNIILEFHTSVPDKYLDGSFVLSSHTGDDVTYSITECEKDKSGRYIAKYSLEEIELAEPVTLTVCDAEGEKITSKTKSAAEYCNAILSGSTANDKEKNVVKALLNFGHYAQLASSEAEGWEIGKKYAEINGVSVPSVDPSVFDQYAIKWRNPANGMNDLSVSLLPGYNSDIMFTVPSSANPVVKINGDTVKTSLNEGRFAFVIEGINALNPVKKYTVCIDDSVFTFSLLSYWSLTDANGKNGNAAEAFKSLYEFYCAALDCQT